MNHETQRLLFAAGRGARVQIMGAADRWALTSTVMLFLGGWPRRIHPEDAHLQYGSISTELRRRADDEHYVVALTPYAWMADTWVHYCAGTGTITFHKNGNYRWLCAFAAELAADEGM